MFVNFYKDGERMKSKMTKLFVMGVALASFFLMGCDSGCVAEADADGNEYPTVKIGNQVWMVKNLNVNVDGSVCYDNDPANCVKYGRPYTWVAAQRVCPAGLR